MLKSFVVLLACLLCIPGLSTAQDDQGCTPQPSYVLDPRIWWKAVPPRTDLTLLGYRVDRKQDTELWQMMRLVPPDTIEYRGNLDKPPLEPGHTYKYRVFAVYRLPSGQEVQTKEANYALPHPCFAFLELPGPTDLSGEIIMPR